MIECVCPVCNGSGRKPAGDYKYKNVIAGYDKETDTLQCDNCGGQRMYGRPTGKTRARADGTPCVHEYTSQNLGRCYNRYTCKHCEYAYDIDSSD
jgi:hypothetical protein